MPIFDPYTYDLATTARAVPLEAALAADPLLEVPGEVRQMLKAGLTAAVEGAVDLWERTPPMRRAAPLSPVQHTGKRRFPPEVLRGQTLPGWHRLVGLELGLAVEALEALAHGEESPRQREKLAEQCARVGQLYTEMAQRAGAWVAEALLRWELRVLRYRASPLLAPLIYH